MNWKGVMPAVTTPFDGEMKVDHVAMAEHCRWLADNGCTGIVALGSLGEGATLSANEKVGILQNLVAALGLRVPIVAAISSLSTADAVAQAGAALKAGCSALMVLPPYVYLGDWREMKAHVSRADSGTRGGAEESRGGKGVECRRPPGRGDPRIVGRSSGSIRRCRRRHRRGNCGRRNRLDRRPGQCISP